MSVAIRFDADQVRSLNHTVIGAAYMGVGTAFDEPVRHLFLENLTDVLVMVSFDGITDHFPLPSNAFFSLDVTKNKNIENGFFIGAGQRIYVKGAPTRGIFYVTAIRDEPE